MEESAPQQGNQLHQNASNKAVMTEQSQVRGYIEKAISPNTRKAYRADLAHFQQHGGSIPSSSEEIAVYLTAFAGVSSIATLTRRIASISVAHSSQGFTSPTKSDLVRLTLKGIRRAHGKPQRQVLPLSKEDMIAIVTTAPDTLTGVRDVALLLTAFCGALRSAETVALQVRDIEFNDQGAIILIRRSKTDAGGHGTRIGIPFAKGRVCCVAALKAWIEKAGLNGGPLFRTVEHGQAGANGLCTKTVANIVKRHVRRIGLDPALYSSHSSRAGLCTAAAQAGIPVWKIKTQSRHASDGMLMRYVRDGDLFRDNAAAIF